MKKILIVNPPFDKTLLRSNVCSHTTKANYYWPPIDMVALSGILNEFFDLFVMDCIADKITDGNAERMIIQHKPDIIISMTSTISEGCDSRFLKKLKEVLKNELLVIGDVAYFSPEEYLVGHDFVDAIIFDYTERDIARYLDGEREDLSGLAYRNNDNNVIISKERIVEFDYGIPPHEKFNLHNYALPFSRYHKVTSSLTSYGCPFKCRFCSGGALPYKLRNIDNLIEEFKYLDRIKVGEVYFLDLTFTVNKKRVLEICKRMVREKISVPWSCLGRVDTVDQETLEWMKKAGCYLIFFGVESGNDEVLKKNNKGTTLDQIREIFTLCRDLQIETLGSFVIGLPGDTEATINETINFAIELNCDYASFNMLVPRHGSPIRDEVDEFDDLSNVALDSTKNAYDACGIPEQQLLALHKKALRSFYFRPSYLIKTALKIRNPYQFFTLFKNGIALLKRTFFNITS